MRIAVAAAALLLPALAAPAAEAQVTVGAAIGQANQASGKSDSSHLGPGFGGSSLAGVGMIDVAIRPRVAVGGEVSLAGDIGGAQRERAPEGDNALISEHHDTVFSGVLKIGTAQDQRVRASAVVGGGIAQRRTERNGTFLPFLPSSRSSAVHEQLSDYVLAFTGGFDVAVGLSAHVALVGVGRLYQLKDDDREGSGVVHRGVSSTIVRYGGGLQIRF
jgi:opacity protein-like surface antigen